MKKRHILVDIGHPGDVHVFYHPIQGWLAHGHRVSIITSDKDVSLQLLNAYGLAYHIVGKRRPGLFNLVYLLGMRTLRIARLAWRDRPDVFVSICSPTGAIAAWLVGRPHIAFDDSEFGTQQRALFTPFTQAICTPRQFELDLGKKQVRYDGFKELSYLHPNVFTPDPQAVQAVGIDPHEKFFVVRSVAWDAAHDYGEHGFTKAGHDRLLALLEQHGRVIVSYEGHPPKDLQTGKTLPSAVMLHLLAFAQMLISEGLTMVTEAALLGTPAILVNTLQAGNMKLLQERYHLAATFADDSFLECVEQWANNPNLKAEAAVNRQRLLGDMVDVNAWMTQFVEDFMESRS